MKKEIEKILKHITDGNYLINSEAKEVCIFELEKYFKSQNKQLIEENNKFKSGIMQLCAERTDLLDVIDKYILTNLNKPS